MIAEILTYVDYIAFSERLRQAQFTRGHERGATHVPLVSWEDLKLDVLALSKEVLGYTQHLV